MGVLLNHNCVQALNINSLIDDDSNEKRCLNKLYNVFVLHHYVSQLVSDEHKSTTTHANCKCLLQLSISTTPI